MLLTKRLDIRINRNSIQHYTNLGYKFKMWDYINIPIEHIISGSKCLVDVKCDYYDNEYIKENFKLNSNNKNYPTIDHKNSIFYGFINNVSSNEIGGLSNLCITKRFINGSKNKKTEEEFYEVFKNIQRNDR